MPPSARATASDSAPGGPRVLSWTLRLIPALILGQTLFFKFTADPAAVALFAELGAEPWGRLATGLFEAIAVVLLLMPGTAFFGGLLTVGLMAGAIFSHLAVLGIEVDGDGGLLFGMAVVSLLAGLALAYLTRRSGFAWLRARGVPVPKGLG